MNASDVQSQVIVGFEIHVQLATKTKLFCGCAVEYGATPNSRTCPVCLGLPGALPVMNRQAFEFAVLTGLALNCTVNTFSKWDRKSYYYPDLPKNYQISQYDLPLSHDGRFDIEVNGATKRIGIIRVHLEEDAGKNVHDVGDASLIDLNRAGTPLLEIVTRPDIRSAEEAYIFCNELQRLVTYLGVSRAVMQKGQMRFEPNINVSITTDGAEYRTPIAEVKNLNSFRAVRMAIEYEHKRQVQDWRADNGYRFKDRPNENRGWDDDRRVTVFQRGKEEAHDYRYFPEPDLVPVTTDTAWLDALRGGLPELPQARRRRLMADYGLSDKDASTIVADRASADLFERSVAAGGCAATVAKQFINVWARLANERGASVGELGVDAERLGQLAKLVDAKNCMTALSELSAAREDDALGLGEAAGERP